MNLDELRELPADELASHLDEVKEEYFNLRFQNATGQLENYAQIKLVKRDIARIHTVVRERELGLEFEPKPERRPSDKPRRERGRKGKAGSGDEAGED